MNFAKCVAGLGTMALAVAAHAAGLTEDFSDLSSLAGKGWVQTNNSTTGGTTDWFPGNPSGADFTGQSGNFIASNFNAAGFGGDVDNWLISPDLDLSGGGTLTFFTRTEADAFPGDMLEVRFSSTGSASTSSFTNLLLTVSPDGNSYPESWTSFTVTLPTVVEGRFAFRYLVNDTSVAGDFIGIDTVSVNVATAVPEPSTYALMAFGLGALAFVSRKRRTRLAAALAAAATLSVLPMAHAADAGMTVTKDPQTGRLRAPTAEEMEALKAKEAANPAARNLRAAPAVERYHANGTVSLMLDESHMNYSVVSRNPDGSLSEDCVVGADAANAAVSAKPKTITKAVTSSSKEHAHEVR